MAAKFSVTPPGLNECKTYEAFKRKLSAWESITELPKTKRGNLVALSLPYQSKFGNNLRERLFEHLNQEELNSEDGLDKVIEFLDKELGKDAVEDVIEKWDQFDSCRRGAGQSLEDFVSDFELKWNRVKSTGTQLSEEVLTYMLMKRAGLSNLERMLVLSRVDMKIKKELYRNVKMNMANILGKCLKDKEESAPTIKLEPAYLSQHEDALAAAGYYKIKPVSRDDKSQKPK